MRTKTVLESPDNKPTILETPNIVAWILTKYGIPPKPFRRPSDGKVVFSYEQDVSACIESFYANSSVGISDFCKNLQLVRSMIFSFKGAK